MHHLKVLQRVVLGDFSHPEAWFRFPADSRTDTSTDFRVEMGGYWPRLCENYFIIFVSGGSFHKKYF